MTEKQCSDRIAHAYFFAKKYVISKGFSGEIDWQESIDFSLLNEQKFMKEISWVILASGMNDKVIRKVFPKIKEVMFDFQSIHLIIRNINECFNGAIKIFNNPRKIAAILNIACYLNNNSFDQIKNLIAESGIEFIQTFPYMGRATSFHFAKNIGLDVAKPDRHLVRISGLLGYSNPDELCREISVKISEKVCLVDLVLWRYATLDRNYMRNIEWYLNDRRRVPVNSIST